MKAYEIFDPGGVEVLRQACAAADRAEQLSKVIARDGVLVEGKDGRMQSNVLLKDELACRAFVVRAFVVLGLNVAIEEPRKPGRPPRKTLNW